MCGTGSDTRRDSGADMNCIKQGIVSTKYCEKSKEELASAKLCNCLRSLISSGNFSANDLTLEAKLFLIQNPPQRIEIPPTIPIEISQISETEVPTKQFTQTISKITFQK